MQMFPYGAQGVTDSENIRHGAMKLLQQLGAARHRANTLPVGFLFTRHRSACCKDRVWQPVKQPPRQVDLFHHS